MTGREAVTEPATPDLSLVFSCRHTYEYQGEYGFVCNRCGHSMATVDALVQENVDFAARLANRLCDNLATEQERNMALGLILRALMPEMRRETL